MAALTPLTPPHPVAAEPLASPQPVTSTYYGRAWSFLSEAISQASALLPSSLTATPAEAPSSVTAPSLTQRITDSVFASTRSLLSAAGGASLVLQNPAANDWGLFFLGENRATASLDFDCFTPTQNLLEQLCPSNNLPKIAMPTPSTALPSLLRTEKQLIDSLSQTLTHVVAIQGVNAMIGARSLSLEETKQFLRSEAPYKEYLQTLSWWRKIIAFLILYIFIHPAAKLVLQGSQTSKGAVEKMRDHFVSLGQDTKKCRQLVTSLFSVLGDTIFEYASIAKNFAGEKTLAIFREEELQKRMKEHGYDHAKVLAGFNTWVREITAIKSDIPLIGPLIDKIVNTSLEGMLAKQDYISQILSLIDSPSNTHNSPVAYKLLQSIAYLLKQANEQLEKKYKEQPRAPDINQEIETTFNPTELLTHESQIDRIADLPYANADTPEKIEKIRQLRGKQEGNVNPAIWDALLRSIKVVANEGAALLLNLIVSDEKTSEIRAGFLQKIKEVLTEPLGDIPPAAYRDVNELVSANAMGVIRMALEHEFEEKALIERMHYSYEYAQILITTMKAEMTDVINELSNAVQNAYQIEEEGPWQQNIAQAISIVMKGIATLKARLALLKNVPVQPPFNQAFLNKIAGFMHSEAKLLANNLAALKSLASQFIPSFMSLKKIQRKIHELLESDVATDPLAPAFAGLNKRALLSLHEELRPYVASETLTQIYQYLEMLENAQYDIKQAAQKEAFLRAADEALVPCKEIIERASSYGDKNITNALWSVNYDREAIIEQITICLESGKLTPHPYIDQLKSSTSIHHLNSTLYLYLRMLENERARALASLPLHENELKRLLVPCRIPYSSDYIPLDKRIKEEISATKAHTTTKTAEITACRTSLLGLYRNIDNILNRLLESKCRELNVAKELQDEYTVMRATRDTLVPPRLALGVELTELLSLWPFSLLGYSREGIKKQVDPMAQRQVCLGRDFLHKPDVLAHITRRFMTIFFC